MFESFVIMLREGIEGAIILGILIVAVRAIKRKDLEKVIWQGLLVAVFASILVAFSLWGWIEQHEEVYEGFLFFASGICVLTMMWWMQKHAKNLKSSLEKKVEEASKSMTLQGGGGGEKLGLGVFTFLMIFREGVESVVFLTAVNLNSESILGFFGGLAGLMTAVLFCFLFIRGTILVNLRRFFLVTEGILSIFVVQLFINGYHEFSEAGILPANQLSMSIVGPVVRHNTLFLLAILSLPFLIILSKPVEADQDDSASPAEKRLLTSKVRRFKIYRIGVTFSLFFLVLLMSIVYAHEIQPKMNPLPKPAKIEGVFAIIPTIDLKDGKLHHYGLLLKGTLVRFIIIQTSDKKYRTGLDACKICGSSGYIQEGKVLTCLNCSSAISPKSLGLSGGCNPIPIPNQLDHKKIKIPIAILKRASYRFEKTGGKEIPCPVCGMKIKVRNASGFTKYGNRIYYFCSMGNCQKKFMEHPKNFHK